MDDKDYSGFAVKKPWGHEYLAYQNKNLGIWLLYIKENGKTSMHCHPKKNTGLICLDGLIEVSFLKNKIFLKDVDKIMVFRGRFHSTKALSSSGAWVMEVESPQDKSDLVRLKDDHGRENDPYEGSESEIPKTDDMLWIEDPVGDDKKEYVFQDTQLSIYRVSDVKSLCDRPYNEVSVFLSGGLQTAQGDMIIQPGDVIAGHILNILAPTLKFQLSPDTMLLSLRKS